MSPTVSVIIPTRDRWDLLGATLRSVLCQSMEDLEVVVVDDGSKDLMEAEILGVDDARVRWVRNQVPGGASVARNTGLAQSVGPWVAFVDDDDLWAPDKLALQLEALAATSAEWCFASAVHVKDSLKLCAFCPAPARHGVVDRLLAANVIPGGASGVMASRALVERVGGFDPSLSLLADWDLWIRMALAAEGVPVTVPVVAYRVHRAAMSMDVGAAHADLSLLLAKHAAERKRRRVEFDDLAWSLWRADRLQRGRARVPAVRARMSIARSHGGGGHWAQVVSSAVWPGSVVVGEWRGRRRMPVAMRRNVEEWLQECAHD